MRVVDSLFFALAFHVISIYGMDDWQLPQVRIRRGQQRREPDDDPQSHSYNPLESGMVTARRTRRGISGRGQGSRRRHADMPQGDTRAAQSMQLSQLEMQMQALGLPSQNSDHTIVPHVEIAPSAYHVFKMTAAQLPGVVIPCETHKRNPEGQILKTQDDYPMEEHEVLYVIVRGTRIIGRTNPELEFDSIIYDFGIDGMGKHEATMEFGGRATQARVAFSSQLRGYGLYDKLPDDTVYHDTPLYQYRRIIHKDTYTGAIIATEYVYDQKCL